MNSFRLIYFAFFTFVAFQLPLFGGGHKSESERTVSSKGEHGDSAKERQHSSVSTEEAVAAAEAENEHWKSSIGAFLKQLDSIRKIEFIGDVELIEFVSAVRAIEVDEQKEFLSKIDELTTANRTLLLALCNFLSTAKSKRAIKTEANNRGGSEQQLTTEQMERMAGDFISMVEICWTLNNEVKEHWEDDPNVKAGAFKIEADGRKKVKTLLS